MKKYNFVGPFLMTVMLLQLFISLSASADIKLIESLDKDQDGQITIKEAVANPAVLASFGKIDLDGDGKISPAELTHTKLKLVEEKQSNKTG